MNSVSLIGNLATDVDLRDAGNGKVASFVLAVDRAKDEADFVPVTAWDRQAEVCAEFLAKGRRVGVSGRLRSHSWQDADGNRRSKLEVVAGRVEFLSGPDARASADVIPFESAAASA